MEEIKGMKGVDMKYNVEDNKELNKEPKNEQEIELEQENQFYLDISDEHYIIDEFIENIGRPEDKKLKVYIKPLTGKDIIMSQNLIRKDLTDYKKDNPNNEYDFYTLYSSFASKWDMILRIEKLENFFMKTKEGIKEITKVEELLTIESGKTARITEQIIAHFLTTDRFELKN